MGATFVIGNYRFHATNQIIHFIGAIVCLNVTKYMPS